MLKRRSKCVPLIIVQLMIGLIKIFVTEKKKKITAKFTADVLK